VTAPQGPHWGHGPQGPGYYTYSPTPPKKKRSKAKFYFAVAGAIALGIFFLAVMSSTRLQVELLSAAVVIGVPYLLLRHVHKTYFHRRK
jgi:hypothetical protein